MGNIQYLDINGLTYYDARIKQFIEDNIPEAAEAFVNAIQESGEPEILKIAVCTQETYDDLGDNWEENTLYIISDDNTLAQLTNLINSVSVKIGNTSYAQDSNHIITLPEYPTRNSLQVNNVENTGDSATPTENGTDKFTTGGAYVLQQSINSITQNAVTNVQYDNTNKKLTKTIDSQLQDIVSVSTLKSDMDLANAELNTNKVTSTAGLVGNTDDVKYPTTQLLRDNLDLKVDKTQIGYIETSIPGSSAGAGRLAPNQYLEALKTYCIIKNIDTDSSKDYWYKSAETTTEIKFKPAQNDVGSYSVFKVLKNRTLTVNKSDLSWVVSNTDIYIYPANNIDGFVDNTVEVQPATGQDVFTYDGDTVQATFRFKNLKTAAASSKVETLGIANSTTAGLMSHSDYVALQDVIQRVGHLEGQTSRLLYVVNDTLKTIDTYSPAFYINEKIYVITNSTTITRVDTADTYTITNMQAIIDGITYKFAGLTVGSKITRDANATNIDAFTRLLGYTSPYKGVAVVTNDTYNIWRYYENTDGGHTIGWNDEGQDTVSQFSNSTPGIIQGSSTDGYISADNGTGSVNGWNKVTTLDGYFTNGVTTETWVFLVKDTETGQERELNKTIYMVPDSSSNNSNS